MNKTHPHRVYALARERLNREQPVVLATLVFTAGSSPQKAGSVALFDEHGLLAGTVGGGNLEKEVGHIARSVLVSGISDSYYIEFDGKDASIAYHEGDACGGEALVLVDAGPGHLASTVEAMERDIRNGRSGHVLTFAGERGEDGRSLASAWIPEDGPLPPIPGLSPELQEKGKKHLRDGEKKSFVHFREEPEEKPQGSLLCFHRIEPLSRLVIAGAGHVGQALAHQASLLDFEVTVVDDRSEFARPDRLPDADRLVVEDIGTFLASLEESPATYVVIATRGHAQDAEALRSCLRKKLAYLGMIGSKPKVALMKQRFLENGWAREEEWARIHSPIGLDIGSKTVQEIAVSIAAQLIRVRSEKNKFRENP
ncbi:MAG: XdhC family protein [Bacteroidales bacterium]